MKINKEEALVLAKILHQNLGPYGLAAVDKSEFQEALEDLAARVDEFLVYGDEEEAEEHECCDHGEEDDDEGDEDLGEEEEDSGEEDEEDDEESGEDEESSEEDDGDYPEDEEEELNADSYVGGEELHALKSAKSSDGAVEFEHAVDDDHSDEDHVDLLVDGYTELSNITHVRRKGKELHVRDGAGDWYTFSIPRFPKGWSDVLPLDELVEVEA